MHCFLGIDLRDIRVHVGRPGVNGTRPSAETSWLVHLRFVMFESLRAGRCQLKAELFCFLNQFLAVGHHLCPNLKANGGRVGRTRRGPRIYSKTVRASTSFLELSDDFLFLAATLPPMNFRPFLSFSSSFILFSVFPFFFYPLSLCGVFAFSLSFFLACCVFTFLHCFVHIKRCR